MTHKVLVIDDVRVFNNSKNLFDVTYARTSEEGTKRLQEGGWDTIFFDHDLGGDATTLPCARYVVEHAADFRDIGFVVHTSNPYGGDTIVSMFKAVGLSVLRQTAGLWFSGTIDD